MLVMAILLLGLGMAFVRNFFDKGTESLMEPFNLLEFGLEPSSSDPVVINKPEINIKSGKKMEDLKIGIYNLFQSETNLKPAILSCSNGQATFDPLVTAIAQPIGPGEKVGFRVFLEAKKASDQSNIPAGSYICNLQAVEDGNANNVMSTEQITLIVST